MLNSFHKNGYLIVKNFHNKTLIAQIKKDIFDISYELYRKHNPKFNSKNIKVIILIILS